MHFIISTFDFHYLFWSCYISISFSKPTKWGPQTIAKLFYFSNHYGLWFCFSIMHGVYKPTCITGEIRWWSLLLVLLLLFVLVYYQIYIYINILLDFPMIIILSSIIIQNDFTTWQSSPTSFDGEDLGDHPTGKHDSLTNKTCFCWYCHWIGLRENWKETMVFTIKYRAFL